jgi:ATP-dependent exoDNAse (exonuclease V) alpha subunit
MIDPTPHQREALEKVLTSPDQARLLTGFAGVGKTALLGILEAEQTDFDHLAFWTSTGRSAAILNQKVGSPVFTAHSGLYGRGTEKLRQAKDHKGEPLWYDDGRPLMVRTGDLSFGNPRDPLCEDYTLIVIDEASMINKKLFDDMMSVLPPTCAALLVRDDAQLKPVKGKMAMEGACPTASLTEIHRQAWDSQIIRYATSIRAGEGGSHVDWSSPELSRAPFSTEGAAEWLYRAMVGKRDAILVTGTNKVRQQVNELLRRRLGYDDLLVVGERLCCFRNDHQRGVMNGEILQVDRFIEVDISPLGWAFMVWADGDPRPFLVHPGTIGASAAQWANFFDGVMLAYSSRDSGAMDVVESLRNQMSAAGKPDSIPDTSSPSKAAQWLRKAFMYVDYGYCMTAHKVQGSEFDEVGVLNCPWTNNHEDRDFSRRARYTMATRARNHLRWWE